LFVALSRTTDQFSEDWARLVQSNRIVFLQGYGRGIRALGRLAEYSRHRRLHATTDGARADAGRGPSGDSQAGSGPVRVLDEIEAKTLLRAAGLPAIETSLARSADDAVALAERLGYPVAAKVVSPQVVHKSDVGGVRLGLVDAASVRDAFDAFERIVAGLPGAGLEGASIQPMARPGLELVLGMNRDPLFGPVLLFGLGGIFVEVLHDVALRLAPLTEVDAREMVDEIRGRALLDGARGQPPVDRAAIVAALLGLSRLAVERQEIESIDLNPVLGYQDGLLAVDARVVLRGAV
jgi:acyl-CoA synthetase (NDP forming)